MSQPLRLAVRLGIAVFLVFCIQSMNDTAFAYKLGRNFSRCEQACNEIRLACHDRCQTDCAGLDEAQQEACLLACDEVCVIATQDCRAICLDYLFQGPPAEP